MRSDMHTDSAVKSRRCHLFIGEDEYCLERDARSLVDKLVPLDQQTLGLEIIASQARNADEAAAAVIRCIEAVRTPGFIAARKVVWLRGVNFLGRSVVALAKQVKEILGVLADVVTSGFPQGNFLVITADKVDRASALFKAISSAGEIHQQQELKPNQKEKAALYFVRELLQKNGLQASQEIIMTIVNMVGADSRQLFQEVAKLAAYMHPRQKVGEDDVAAIMAATRESEAMHLADAVGARNLSRAIVILRQLLFQKENPIGIVMALEARFRYLLLLRAAGEGNEKITITSEKGKPLHPYFESRLREQANKYTLSELKERRQVLLETRLKQVSSSSGLEEILLERLLVKLCRRRKSLVKSRLDKA